MLKDLKIGSWNVLSPYRPRTLKMLLDQINMNWMMFNTKPEGKRGTARPKLRWSIVWIMTSGF
jgi:hypothetical protein